MIVFSSFNNVELFHSMLADCCMPKSREWGPMVAVGQWQLPWSIDAWSPIVLENSSPGLIPPISLPLPPCIIPQWCCCPNNEAQWPIWYEDCHANGSDANKDAHRHLVRRDCQSHGTKPNVFLRRTKPTTNTKQSIDTWIFSHPKLWIWCLVVRIS